LRVEVFFAGASVASAVFSADVVSSGMVCAPQPGARRRSGRVRRRDPQTQGRRRKAFGGGDTLRGASLAGLFVTCRGRWAQSSGLLRIAVTDPRAASRSGDDVPTTVPAHEELGENVVGSTPDGKPSSRQPWRVSHTDRETLL
jgi:hypothetical protein